MKKSWENEDRGGKAEVNALRWKYKFEKGRFCLKILPLKKERKYS